jgi:hypothetical protein
MTPKQATELKALIRDNRWVLEELAMDKKTQEAVRLMNGPSKELVKYLVSVYGSVAVVLSESKYMVDWMKGRRFKTLNTDSLIGYIKSKQSDGK